MPVFNGFGPLSVSVCSGTSMPLFSATDTLAAGNNSVVIAPVDSGPVSRQGIQFQQDFASAPTAVVEIFGSNTSPTSSGPQKGQLLFTFTNLQSASYVDNNSYAFYWAELVSQSGGGALTLMAHVR